jgi:hypothetical protein
MLTVSNGTTYITMCFFTASDHLVLEGFSVFLVTFSFLFHRWGVSDFLT